VRWEDGHFLVSFVITFGVVGVVFFLFLAFLASKVRNSKSFFFSLVFYHFSLVHICFAFARPLLLPFSRLFFFFGFGLVWLGLAWLYVFH